MEANVITVNQTARAYDAMREDGSRLPWKEVGEKNRKFSNQYPVIIENAAITKE